MELRFDFTQLREALARMGGKPVEFSSQSLIDPLDPIDIALEGGLEILDLSELETSNGLLNYKGRQILLYIQDHGGNVQQALENGKKGRKFHIAECRTLDEMRQKGRFERYVVTNRLDGEFFISGNDWATQQQVEGHTRLWVCQNCLKRLNYQGAAYERPYPVAQRFDIGEFFSAYSSFFEKLPRRHAGQGADDTYAPNWPTIAGEYKAGKDFLCEGCGVDLRSRKDLLHVHHRNGVKGDNSLDNLAALCVACHRDQPQHTHMFVRHADMQAINRLRAEQGGFQSAGWSDVLEYSDPALRGLLDACQREGADRPEVGLDVQDRSSAVVANLEIAWPKAKIGVAIGDDDRIAAESAGWRVWQMIDVLQDTEAFVAATKGQKR